VLTIGLTIGRVPGAEQTNAQPPLAIGGVLMVMIFMGTNKQTRQLPHEPMNRCIYLLIIIHHNGIALYVL
jgi:hypothetical protein